MLRRTLNLGILAHVDAGKTTLTERLLYATGVIDAIGSVDAGTTQTDSLALEQQRGITIKTAVASFAVGGVAVNLIDTPGHPDFIAEVERVLSVLDGVVLVVSAVEGVQPQTRVLMRALQRLRIPTLVFVNKVDRVGAECARVLADVSERLTPATVAMTAVHAEGTRAARSVPLGAADVRFRARLAELLAEHDESILAAFVESPETIPYPRLREELAAQTKRALVHPVFLGSAHTGAGVEPLLAGLAELLPAAAEDADGAVAATVFKIERGRSGEKVAYVRMFAGTVRTRDRLHFRGDSEAKVTAISVFDAGSVVQRPAVSGGAIAKLWGLADVQIGDSLGDARARTRAHQFAPPTVEAVVVPLSPDEGAQLRVALAQLAEQDPLINVRQDDTRREISVSLYGEVQKEVIEATLADDYGIGVTFRETTPICVERPAGAGEAVEILHAESNPFMATIGLRVEPAPAGSGVEFRLRVDHRTIPAYVYKKLENFAAAMERHVRQALEEGLFGWRVTDCVVTMIESNYSSPDGPAATRGPLSTAADFRKLTPLVLMQALERAGTVVCEPTVRVSLELPNAAFGAVLSALARLGGAVETPSAQGPLTVVEALLPAARADDLHRRLPGLTGGEGVLESTFVGYQPVTGDPPTRPRTTANPLDLGAYMTHLAGRVGDSARARDE